MILTDSEVELLGEVVDILDMHYAWLDVLQTETDRGHPYILLSQPASAPGGMVLIFIQPCEWTSGWEVRGQAGVLAFDAEGLTGCLERFLARVSAGSLSHALEDTPA